MEKIRQDVWSFAKNLSVASDLDADAVYVWLMALGRHFGTNPKDLWLMAVPGLIWLASEPDRFYLDKFTLPPVRGTFPEPGTDYESLILERQENLD